MARLVRILIVTLWIAVLGVLLARQWEAGQDAASPGEVLGAPAATESQVREFWYGVYLQNSKIGYSHTRLERSGEGFLFEETSQLDLRALGEVRHVRTGQKGILARDYSFQSLDFSLESEGSRFELSARLEGAKIQATLRTTGGEQEFSLPAGGPIYTSAALYPYLRAKGIRVGDVHRLLLFDPMSQENAVLTAKIISRGEQEIGGEKHVLFEMQEEMYGATSRAWIDEEADLWKEESAEGFVILREGAQEAPRGIGGSEVDLALAYAVPLEGKLVNPESLSSVTYRFQGMTPDVWKDLAGFRQEVGIEEGGSQTLRLTRESLAPRGGYALPYGGESEREFLAEEPLIPVSNPKLVSRARSIVGAEHDPLAAARLLTGWVYEGLEKTLVAGIPNALEALETRQGDCNEHATLLVGLARAAGIPARLASGLVYLEGSFYYHAWAELFVGQWVSADATTNQLPADVTHIRLATGSLGSQAKLLGVFGKLRIKLEETR